ncbi:MAG: 3-phosphoshikimate 1-carboxyvinyltransferase [Candidatus Odinarchaeia archaeon]
MGHIKIEPITKLNGFVTAPPSKSHTHRVLIIGLLSDDKTIISNPLIAGDVKATINACKQFGAKIKIHNEKLEITPPSKLHAPINAINAENSGSTIRFMCALAALAEGETTLTGSPSLKKRPMNDLVDALREFNVECEYLEKEGFPPIKIKGSPNFGGMAEIPGNVSSQFISALLLTLPSASKDSTLLIKPPIKSKPYIEMTLDLLKTASIKINYSNNLRRFQIPGNQKYNLGKYTVPGDFSSAAFILAAAAITDSKITITNIDFNSKHADKKIISDLINMGANIDVYSEENKVVINGAKLVGRRIFCGNTPDLIPVLAAVAAYAKGKTVLYGAEHVRYKESNRLFVLATELKKMGINIRETKTGLTINGGSKITTDTVLRTYGDHRIFMALTLIGLKAKKPIIIEETKSYLDSYPGFIFDLKKIGARIMEEN